VLLRPSTQPLESRLSINSGNDDLFQNETSVVPSFHNCARKLAQPVFHLEPRHALLAFFYTVAQLRHPVADNINSPSCS
jgi:hypothetical protein